MSNDPVTVRSLTKLLRAADPTLTKPQARTAARVLVTILPIVESYATALHPAEKP